MEHRDLRDLIRFSEEGPAHVRLFASDRLWSEVVCLEGTQSFGPIADPDSDAVCTVLAGRIALQVDRERRKFGQWDSALIPAGSSLTVRNASPEPSVILLIAAPPPTPRAISE